MDVDNAACSGAVAVLENAFAGPATPVGEPGPRPTLEPLEPCAARDRSDVEPVIVPEGGGEAGPGPCAEASPPGKIALRDEAEGLAAATGVDVLVRSVGKVGAEPESESMDWMPRMAAALGGGAQSNSLLWRSLGLKSSGASGSAKGSKEGEVGVGCE